MPALRPHLAAASLAPWDVPQWYQTVAFMRRESRPGAWMEMRDAGGNPARRLQAVLVTDLQPDEYEISAEVSRARAVGSYRRPWDRSLSGEKSRRCARHGKIHPDHSAIAQSAVVAMVRSVELAAGKSFGFSMVLGKLPEMADGSMPPVGEVRRVIDYLSPKKQKAGLDRARRQRVMK